jgi:SAM-dependent methyltransferase
LLSRSKHAIEQTLYYICVAGLAVYLVNQVRKPTKWVGRLFLWMMNVSHSQVTDWGLKHAAIEEGFTILDVGCGGGRTIEKLAALAAKGTVYGVDYAAGSVAASRAKNAQLIQAGRVEVARASVSRLPFAADKFDLVTAVETRYYWPDRVNDMGEVLGVLKPGGTLIVIGKAIGRERRIGCMDRR